MYNSYGMSEIALAPLDANYPAAVTAMQFSPNYEALWAGTDAGHMYALHCPTLRPYAHWPAHPGVPVLEVLAAGEGVLSLSQHRLALHGLGGAPRWAVNDDSGQLSAVCMDAGGAGLGPLGTAAGARAVLGRSGPLMTLVDLGTGKVVQEQEVQGMLGGEGFSLLRGPGSRGGLVAATSMGRLATIDPRTKLRVESALIAAPGGLAALDARGDTVAAAGYGMRAGQVVAENCVKIFDQRAGLRLLYALPTAGPPASLSFHPLLPTTLLVALPSALFCLADTATGTASHVYQADMAGDQLSTATLSPSGELAALGGSGGYVHLWADGGGAGGGGARVNRGEGSGPPPVPPLRPRPTVELREEESFSLAPRFPSSAPTGSLASDWEPADTATVGLAPRVLDPALRKDMRVVDGCGYVPNPHYSRAKPFADMVRELAGLRHGPGCRLSMKADWVDPVAARAERQRQRAAEGGVVLPLRYQYVEIRHYGRVKWEEFDFSYYNRTRFAGLENDLPNAYCNALLQVLYFVPEFRSLVQAHVPEPDAEFCLTCELGFLFAMLQRAVGLPCQATNLLRTLRSLREAAALGLLDGGGIGPAAGAAADAGAAVQAMAALGGGGPGAGETELSRRVAALCRFMLEQMHRDACNARKPSSGPFRSGIAPQPAAANAALAPGLEALMGIAFRMRMTVLSGGGAESLRDARAFQVDLQYPPSREKAARAAEEARQLGLSRLPGAALPEDPPGSTPPFAQLLRRSLLAVSATRAWVDEARAYALVRKSRVPLSLPPLLAINCAVGDSDEAAWWLPARGPDGTAPPGEANRLPWALAIVSRPQAWEVEVHEAETAEQLYAQLGESLYALGTVSCVYELAAAVFQIRDADEATDPGVSRPGAKPHQGHLVAMVKVPQSYWDEIPEPRLTHAPPGSMSEFVGPRPGPGGPGQAAKPQPNGTKGGRASSAGSAAGTGSGAASGRGPSASGGATTGPGGDSKAGAGPAAAGGTAAGGEEEAAAAGLGLGGISLPDDLDDIWSGGESALLSSGGADQQGSQAGNGASSSSTGPSSTPTSTSGPGADGGKAGPAQQRGSTPGGSAGAGAGGAGPQLRHSSSMAHGRGHPQGPEWVLFNDFSVSPNCPAHEVTATYANQKLPCLLQYRQVPPPPHLQAAAAAAATAQAAILTPPPPPPAPVPVKGGPGSKGGRHGNHHHHHHNQAQAQAQAGPGGPTSLLPDQFRQLCASPPLQGAMAGLPPFRFKPLDLVRFPPRPGLRLALDAEFVASSPPESRAGPGAGAGGGVDLVQFRQSRLTLARVAVLLAEAGPQAGACFLDDYIRAVEPVYDYLTRWSGIQPGDLDPAVSRHYTTTLKHTYLKLKYLLDCGCVFVGHDLRKDFRCINMVVPPEQVVDTSELFRYRGGRKLSLRFLASYLLGTTIQQGGALGAHHHHHHHHAHHSHHGHGPGGGPGGPGPGGPGGGAQGGPGGPMPQLLGHDAIEDARTAMRLYHKYLELVASDSFERVLGEMYEWGKQYGWEPVQIPRNNGGGPGGP
ncbi:hypothetical protein HYH03_005077 [Edaphochlamys debaryana]|uniref:Exonuclease domain-containing protein n=1 Tax=Edaphochlamys debaryana TaxID=47281 RepID=A0A836C2U6_9CHLO|nr:hypothetical protein HYH03_005077 [Edaphochlamys debaryana]|eukprot:KAG2497083.1 hypothetical protein HYH03_005077 [Edaphochlamys debaryana]